MAGVEPTNKNSGFNPSLRQPLGGVIDRILSEVSPERPLGGVGGKIMDFMSPNPDPSSKTEIGRFLGGMIPGGRGIMETTNTAASSPVNERAIATQPNATITAADNQQVGGIIEQKPSPSIYDNLRSMSDRDFVNFMSREENKNIPGLGWIGDSKMKFDPKTGKSLDPNFKRLVEDPATRKPEKITVDELEARGKYLQGLGAYEHGIGAREQAAATKAATQEYKTMELQRKASADMQGLIEKFGGLADGTIDPSVALYRMGKAGIPLPSSLSPEDSKRFRAAMDEQTKPLRDLIAENAAKKGSPLTAGEKFTITKMFEKSRGYSILED